MIPYVESDDDRSAASRSLLIAEADAKMALALGGKSPMILGGGVAALMGKLFLFTSSSEANPLKWSAPFSPNNYDHSIFTDAIEAGLTVTSQDDVLKIVTVQTPDLPEGWPLTTLFSQSLEAHQMLMTDLGEKYWIQEFFSAIPEKKYKWAVAELVYEFADRTAPSTVSIPKEWNKYNCFRVHNLNLYPLTITFEGSGATPEDAPQSYTVPAMGCIAIRRISVNSGYEQTYKYFWPLHQGDPRWWSFQNPLIFPQTIGHEPAQTMGANNVTNQPIIYAWLDLLINNWLQPIIGLQRNPAVVYSIPTSGYGDPSNSGTWIGDLLKHRGKLKLFEGVSDEDVPRVTEFNFNGFATLAADALKAGLTVTEAAGGLTIQKTDLTGLFSADLVQVGSNLLGKPLASVVNPLAISFTWPSYAFFYVTPYDAELNWVWYALDGVTPNVLTVTERSITWQPIALTFNLNHKTTVGEVTSFTAVYPEDIVTGQKLSMEATDAQAFTNSRMVLTPFGLKWIFDQELSLDVPIPGWPITRKAGEFYFGDRSVWTEISDDLKIKATHAVTFSGYGWPSDVGSGSTGQRISQHNFNGLFVPRIPRAYSIMGKEHPDVINDPAAPNGEDIDVEPIEDYRESEIAVVGTLTQRVPDLGTYRTMPVWDEPDVVNPLLRHAESPGWYSKNLFTLASGNPKQLLDNTLEMPRQALCRELYNGLAAHINSIQRHRQMLWSDTEDYIAPNEIGIHGSTVRPNNHYATITPDSQAWNTAVKLGIPIKTKADLPESYATSINTTQKWARIVMRMTFNIHSVDRTWIGGGFQYAEVTLSRNLVTPVEIISATEWEAVHRPDPAWNFQVVLGLQQPVPIERSASLGWTQPDMAEFNWIAIEDVKAAVERLGFKFIHQEISVPVELKVVEGDVSELYTQNPNEYLSGFVVSDDFSDLNPIHITTSEWPLTVGRDVTNFIRPVTVVSAAGATQLNWMAAIPRDEVQEWKAAVTSEKIGDQHAGDFLTFGVVNEGQQCYVKLGAEEEFFTLRPECIQSQMKLTRAIQCQVWGAPGKVALIPCGWLDHDGQEFSATSIENANARRAFGAKILPLAWHDKEGSAEVKDLPEGTTILVAPEGQARQVIIMWEES